MDLNIKVPVIITDFLENPQDNFDSMIDAVIAQIESYNNLPLNNKYVVQYRKKLKCKTLKSIDYYKYSFDGIPSLVVKVSEFKTGINDMYIEKKGISDSVSNTDKVGSDYNYAVLYPLISFDDDGNPRNRWCAFVYDDPGKDDADVKNTIKMFLTKVLKLKVKSIQRQGAKDNILSSQIIPSVKVSYVTKRMGHGENIELSQYEVSLKESRSKEILYEDIPSEDVMRLVEDRDSQGYEKRTVKVSVNENTSYKYIHEAQERGELILSVLEENNCYEVSISQEDVETMHEPENVHKYMGGVISQFRNE